jgi:hypothetical protein
MNTEGKKRYQEIDSGRRNLFEKISDWLLTALPSNFSRAENVYVKFALIEEFISVYYSPTRLISFALIAHESGDLSFSIGFKRLMTDAPANEARQQAAYPDFSDFHFTMVEDIESPRVEALSFESYSTYVATLLQNDRLAGLINAGYWHSYSFDPRELMIGDYTIAELRTQANAAWESKR